MTSLARRRADRLGPLRRGVVLGLLGLLLTAVPAYAHSTDPRVVTVVDGVTPALPAGVLVQARSGIAAQLVADNPTAAPLEVLDESGRPFLRLSRAGVFANLGDPAFFATSSPSGATSRPAGPDRFVQVSRGSSWGWYDHRLHPGPVQVPGGARGTVRLAEFAVPMRYAGTSRVVRGHLELRPVLGAFRTEVTASPPGLSAEVLQGRLPGLFVTVSAPLTVLGRDGEPFLRSDGHRLAVNTASRTYVEDLQARGRPAGPPSSVARWQGLPGASYTWLDARLAYPAATPPAPALRTSRPTEVATWRIPVLGAPPLTGVIRWVPDPAAAPVRRRSRAVPWPVIAAVLLGLGGGAVVVRRRRS